MRRFDKLSMITRLDAERALALGADRAGLRVDGNAKYAGLIQRADPEAAEGLRARLNLGQAPLLVAGSVRSGEEEPVLGAFAQLLQSHPQAVLAAVPRHVEKSPRWLQTCARLGIAADLWSGLSDETPRKPDTQVIVVDAMGVLMPLYGLSRVAFLGASLVPLGGQNPMEPAAWGLPVCYGKSMEDFIDAAQALEAAGAAKQVNHAGELTAFWSHCLASPGQADQMGQAAREVVRRWSDAARTAAGLILRELKPQGAL